MKPPPFTYHRPADVDEAVALLAGLIEAGEHPKVLAGGQSLIPLLSMRLAAPTHLVDINALPGLDSIEVGSGSVTVGALVRHRALERHEGAYAAIPLLRQALSNVAHPTIRNRGTTVGSICHADPASEMPAVLALLGGSVTAGRCAAAARSTLRTCSSGRSSPRSSRTSWRCRRTSRCCRHAPARRSSSWPAGTVTTRCAAWSLR
jgi:carbon-monoxide dehydrogenase medium subunit